jgi:hypothetical protein
MEQQRPRIGHVFKQANRGHHVEEVISRIIFDISERDIDSMPFASQLGSWLRHFDSMRFKAVPCSGRQKVPCAASNIKQAGLSSTFTINLHRIYAAPNLRQPIKMSLPHLGKSSFGLRKL